ncbi:MAG TPA: PHP domain-containing protein [Longimicrobiales bacterium]|nr:PHP domain-containing protein [Longimicrobiales bacterium]
MSGAGGERDEARVRVDMHLHTRRSFDCLCPGEEVVRVAAQRGIDRVCITDHNEIEAALELRERVPGRVIVGEEVKTAEGVDIIGLWLTERIPKGTPAREACERIRAQGGLVYVPHPYAGGKGGGDRILEEVEDLVDAIEGFNARIHLARLNALAVSWAAARDLPLGAGSDAHSLREVGRAYVDVPPFEDRPAAFLEALRHGRITGRFSSWGVHLFSTWAKVRKRLPGGRP